MGSFTNLNTYGQETLTLDDNRDPNVIVNLSQPENITDLNLSHSFTVNRNNFEILSISQADITQPLYQIDVSQIAGATVTWPEVYSNSITFEDDGVYYYQFVRSIAEWDDIKDAVINVPTTYFGDIEYTVRLNWVSAGIQEFSFTVSSKIPVSNMASTFAVNANVSKLVNQTRNLKVFSVLNCSGDIV